MPRFVAVALAALAIGPLARAAEPPQLAADAPEKFLPATTQLYVRWDGITAHNDAYKKSVWGPAMAGPTGDSVRTLLAKLPKMLGATVLADPLIDGRSPVELKAALADLKSAEKLVDLIADKGVIVAAEVREPGPTLKGIAGAVGGLIDGKVPGPEALLPDAQVLIIVPNGAGEKAEVVYGSLRLLFKKDGGEGRAVHRRRAQGHSGWCSTPTARCNSHCRVVGRGQALRLLRRDAQARRGDR